MRTKRFTLATLSIDGDDLRLRYGDLIVVAHDEATLLDWELVAMPFEHEPLEQGAYRLEVTTLEGRRLDGDAVLVRSVRGTHVLRGAGPLHGLAVGDLHE